MKATAGWCSWEAYRRDIHQEKIDEVVAFMEKELKDYGLEYIQIDDGYQKMPLPYDPKDTMAKGWLTTEEVKFPKGHQGIVESIATKGFVPAIWTNANITHVDFPKYHEKDVLWYRGEALKGEWIDYLYSCDEETLATHVEPLFESFKTLGYKYIKIDAIRHLLFDGLHEAVRLGMMSNEEAEKKFRAYMEATRKGLGDEVYYLASWGEIHEVIGLVDACRIAMDANPTWAGIRMQLFESARWFHTQRILFQMDPDHVCVRTQEQWAKSVLSLISLSGGLYMLSDKPEAYDQDKLEIIRKTLPPLQTRTAETGPLDLSYPAYTWTKLHGFAVQSNDRPVEAEGVTLKEALDMAGIFPTMEDDHPFSSLWAFHLEHVGRNWCVMGRFATIPLRESRIELERLGLKQDATYLAFDFWEQRFLGQISGELACKSLEIGECQIIALYAMEKVPQLIASTRHVSMDAISLNAYKWEDALSTLSVELGGVRGKCETYTFYMPEGYSLSEILVEGGGADKVIENNVVSIQVKFDTEVVQLQLGFVKE